MNKFFLTLQKLSLAAYCPYSNFRVACCLVLKNSKNIIKGVNVENSSYPCGICAERTAIGQLITKKINPNEVGQILLYADQKDFTYPCGMCRQVICEFFSATTPLIMFNHYGHTKQILVKDLLPNVFNLKKVTANK